MILSKPLLVSLACASFLASCSQNTPEAAPVVQTGPDLKLIRDQNTAQALAEAKAKARTDEKARVLENKRREVEARTRKRRAEIAAQNAIFVTPPGRQPEEKRQAATPKYRTARAITGRPGFVYNPYTFEAVDVRGQRSGSVVVDPNDPAGRKNAFRLP